VQDLSGLRRAIVNSSLTGSVLVSGPDGVRSKRAYFVVGEGVGFSAERKSPVPTPQCLPQEIRGFLSRQESEAVHIPRVHGRGFTGGLL